MNIKLKELLFEAYIENLTLFQREVFQDLMKSGVDLSPIFMDKQKMQLFGGAIRQFMNSNYAPAGYDTGEESEGEVKEKVADFAIRTIDMINRGEVSAIRTDQAASM